MYNRLKEILTWSSALLAFCYAAGFVVTGAYLASLGVSDQSLTEARYLAVGALFWFVFMASTIPIVAGVWSALSQLWIWKSEREKLEIDKPIFIQGLIYSAGLGLLMGPFAGMAVIILGSASGSPITAYGEYHEHPSTFYPLFWELIPGWFGPLYFLAVIGTMLVYIMHSTTHLSEQSPVKKILHPYNSARSNIDSASKRKAAIHWVKLLMLPVIAILTFSVAPYSVFEAFHTYSTKIYPNMNSNIGGGRFSPVHLLTKKESQELLKEAVPMETKFRSAPVILLDEGSRYYVVLYPPSPEGRSRLVEKTLIMGVIPIKKEIHNIQLQPTAESDG